MLTPELISLLYNSIEKQLNQLNHSYQKPSLLAKSILDVSSYFINQSGPSLWTNTDFTAAYIAHFLPMNIFRWLKAFERLDALPFSKLDHFFDYGSGPLTFRIAYLLKYQKVDFKYFFYELEQKPIFIGKNIFEDLAKTLLNNSIQNDLKSQSINPTEIDSTSVTNLVLSYSLNEIKTIPEVFWNFKNLIILEPSTQNISRNLLKFRDRALQKKFFALAPCTHSHSCPLLIHSKKDWCFDRTTIQIPPLAIDLYKLLPFDTEQASFSYLWLSKNKPMINNNDFRVTGDWQIEKGKKKIMTCRSSDREFISLLNKNKIQLNIERGDLKTLDFNYEVKGNEIRILEKP